jgi:phytol kinase
MDDVDALRCTGFLAGLAAFWVVTGWLKEHGVSREGDIRKVNHVAGLAGGALVFGWLPEPRARASLYASSSAVLLLVALVCSLRDRPVIRLAFLANTRCCDVPHQAFYFWSSWLVSVLGLLACDLLFQQVALTRTAALVVGIADGLAEPVGRRFGRHCYRVPSLVGRPSFRSLEGSAAVLVSTAVLLPACLTSGAWGPSGVLLAGLLVGLAVTLVEAASPRGFDNLTIPVASAGLIAWFRTAGWVS